MDPVIFAAGSSVIGPAMEGHLDRVGEFLRKTPFVHLIVAAGGHRKGPREPQGAGAHREDPAHPAGARSRQLRARGGHLLPRSKHREAPCRPPPRSSWRCCRRGRRCPEVRVKEMLDRRAGATRELLMKAEGIPAERLLPRRGPDASRRAHRRARGVRDHRRVAAGSRAVASLCYDPPGSVAAEEEARCPTTSC